MALMGYGTAVNECLAAAEILAKSGIKATVADMRCAAKLCIETQDMKEHLSVVLMPH